MDMSLLKPLSELLGVTINELLAGEKIEEKDIEKKSEENIIDTINYSNKKVSEKNKLIAKILLFFGLGLIFSAFSVFPSESSWGSIYSVIGIVISLLGFTILNKGKTFRKRLLLNIGYTIFIIALLLVLDYSNVKLNQQAPRFRIKTTTTGNVIYYDTLFYDVYRCNFDTENEYWVIEKNSKKSISDLINYCK